MTDHSYGHIYLNVIVYANHEPNGACNITFYIYRPIVDSSFDCFSMSCLLFTEESFTWNN